jgi:acyl phosphate:glycerol-3-phosphate acyltransferase
MDVFDFLTMTIINVILVSVFGYFFGAIPFSFLIGKLFAKKDIRQVGDGNPGGTNAWKAGGKFVGLLSIALDIFKGFLPVYIAQQIGIVEWGLIPVCIAPILGHATQPFLKFRGGKALGVTGGAWAGIIGLWVFWNYTVLSMGALLFVKDHAWAVMVGSTSLLFWAVFVDGSTWMIVLAILTIAIIAWTHHRELSNPPQFRPWVLKAIGRHNND